MSRMKAYAEKVSEDMGFDGEINDRVMEEAQRRLIAEQVAPYSPETTNATADAIEELFCCDDF